ncbi:LysR family transcriptional regulator [Solirubrobacter deserti]|uniref:LysR substrate-binding domain-containing protein n=1 Tax=Solirubrobacter deserti TaxID=2282478 RepID=A0ABT4RDT9_9ACTN|nr:LysR substrate-binding domain-containing protein [Solirubrobacter deserti]MDA0136495.1 LysR substrate-binding domain-containing protein [Solirubrobacter deserti]
MTPDLRQLRYFLAVAEELNFTRAAARLHIAQPPLSAAIRQLEEQLGVTLLHRSSRQVELTAAGALLLERGRELLSHAEAVFAEVRELESAPTGKLTLGVAPTARFELAPAVLAACATRAPGVMLYPREDTTGALLHDLRAGRLDLVLGFCAEDDPALERERLRDAPAVLHVNADHPLAQRASVALGELRDEPIIVAGGPDSPGYTAAVVQLCRDAGFEPRTVPDPYPDLGVQAIREGLGVVVYARSAFAEQVEGSAFVPIEPRVTLPFDLLWRADKRSGALDAVLRVAREVRAEQAWAAP